MTERKDRMQTQHGLAGANTEASLRFHRFHERLNRSLKTQVIGLGMLKDAIDKGETRDGIKEILYAQNDLWGGMPDWGRPQELIDEGRLDIGRAGVVRGFSAFDLFLDNLSAELESYGRFRGAKPKPKGRLPARQGGDGTDDGAAAAEAGLTRYYERIGADLDGVKFLLPLYVYFRVARNCIAHRDAIASGAAEDLSRGDGIRDALEAWPDHTDDMRVPEILPLKEGAEILFTHRQALSNSSILRLIAMDANEKALTILGVEGVVYAAAKRLLSIPSANDPEIRRSMPATINYILSDRYRVRNVDSLGASRILSSLGMSKRCERRFQSLVGPAGIGGG